MSEGQRAGVYDLPRTMQSSTLGSNAPSEPTGAFQRNYIDKRALYNHTGDPELPQSAKIDRENYPEVYSETYPEVQVDKNTLPEVAGDDGPQLAEEGRSKAGNARQRRYCGLRKKRFWILVGIFVVVVIIIAVVGGVVGSRASSRSESSALRILRTTALASVSYKQADGTSQYRVYYQAESGALYQSVWSSETEDWRTSPLRKPDSVNGTNNPVVKLGTPLSAHIYGTVDTNAYEYHLFFLDTDNKIWGTVSADPEDMWNFSGASAMTGNLTAAPYSKLGSYGRQCGENCGNATSIIIWQSDDDDQIWLAGYQPGSGWMAFSNDAELESPPVQGTSITIVSLGADEGLMSIYVNTGSPTELHFNRTDGWASNGTLSGNLDPGAAMVALITNYDSANSDTAEVNIIATKPRSSGGVSLWQDGSLDTSWLNSNAEPPLYSVSNTSSITSNQAGMVYAMEENRIVEWQWESSNSSYVRVGIVRTDV